MVTVREVHEEQKGLLWNILQKYLYEMTVYYDGEMDENGNYRYEYFDAYFTEEERKALLIYDDETLAGFAMINNHSYLGKPCDYSLAEFTVFPMYRKRGIATDAATQIFKKYVGGWELKFTEKSDAAKSLWLDVTDEYCTKAWRMTEDELVLSFSTAPLPEPEGDVKFTIDDIQRIKMIMYRSIDRELDKLLDEEDQLYDHSSDSTRNGCIL